MERLVEIKVAKFNILSILDCYYRPVPLIYISYDSEGIKIQGSCKDQNVLATMTIPQDSSPRCIQQLKNCSLKLGKQN